MRCRQRHLWVSIVGLLEMNDPVWVGDDVMSDMTELRDMCVNRSCQCEVWEQAHTCDCLWYRTKGFVLAQLARMNVEERLSHIMNFLVECGHYENEVASLNEELDLR